MTTLPGLFWGRRSSTSQAASAQTAANNNDNLTALLPGSKAPILDLLRPSASTAKLSAPQVSEPAASFAVPHSACFRGVLNAVAACVREQLTEPLTVNDTPFSVPHPHSLEGPFPSAVRLADPDYFTALKEQLQRSQQHSIGLAASLSCEETLAASLRWMAQHRIALEQRRLRCEHLLSLLTRENTSEMERDARLRLAISRYLASNAKDELTALHASVDARHGLQLLHRKIGTAAASTARGIDLKTSAFASGEWADANEFDASTSRAQGSSVYDCDEDDYSENEPGVTVAARSSVRAGVGGSIAVGASSKSASARAGVRVSVSKRISKLTLSRGGGPSGISRLGARTAESSMSNGVKFTRTDLQTELFAIAKERAEAADGLMHVAEAYCFISSSTVALYLKDAIREAEELWSSLLGQFARLDGDSSSVVASDLHYSPSLSQAATVAEAGAEAGAGAATPSDASIIEHISQWSSGSPSAECVDHTASSTSADVCMQTSAPPHPGHSESGISTALRGRRSRSTAHAARERRGGGSPALAAIASAAATTWSRGRVLGDTDVPGKDVRRYC